MNTLKYFIKHETVLTIAAILALLSMVIIHPDNEYLSYIDTRTLAILFSLMAVMSGLTRQGIFEKICRILLTHTTGMRQIVYVLVGLCFMGSMIITNDVALLTFVPFTFIVLKNLGNRACNLYIIPVVCMQTIAANLGSMLTPIGNPQNLYLFGKSNMTILQFVQLMLPYSLAAFLLLLMWIIAICRKQKITNIEILPQSQAITANKPLVFMNIILFIICILAVMRILPYAIAFILVLVCNLCFDRKSLNNVDYSLLLTFVAFFIFIGNLGRISVFSDWLKSILTGHEVIAAVLASQITSNVPAALLLSGFTSEIPSLIIGTNLGGLGTLIASMASLISYRQIAREMPDIKNKYFRMFTISNLIFLVILLSIMLIIYRI